MFAVVMIYGMHDARLWKSFQMFQRSMSFITHTANSLIYGYFDVTVALGVTHVTLNKLHV